MTSQVGGFQNPGVCLQAFPSIFPHPLPALLLAPFFARSLTLVPRSLLLNRTETLATQAIVQRMSNPVDSLDFSQPWQFSDVVLVVEEDRFNVHRCILGMWSEVFTTMFTAQFKEKTAEEVPLPGKKSAEIKEMLLVIYPTSAKPIDESNYAFLLDLAKEYMMAKLTEKCENYLISRLNPRTEMYSYSQFGVGGFLSKGNCLELLDIAENHGLDKLRTACIKIAQCIKFQDLKKDNIYQKISFSNYRKIVEGMFENYERRLARKESGSRAVCSGTAFS